MSSDAPIFDPALWFRHDGCKGKHYILGNPHTTPGRIFAWCPKEGCSLFVNRADMSAVSKASMYWLEGYFHGAEPDPPAGKEGPPDFGSKAYVQWSKNCERFRQIGQWKALVSKETGKKTISSKTTRKKVPSTPSPKI